MSSPDHRAEIYVAVTAEQAFAALSIHISQWWTIHANSISCEGQQLNVRFENQTAWSFKITEFTPNKSLTWHTIYANHNQSALAKKDEWLGTDIKWTIEQGQLGSKITLHHQGLNNSLKCHQICAQGWDYFLESLKKYLETGSGFPYDQA